MKSSILYLLNISFVRPERGILTSAVGLNFCNGFSSKVQSSIVYWFISTRSSSLSSSSAFTVFSALSSSHELFTGEILLRPVLLTSLTDLIFLPKKFNLFINQFFFLTLVATDWSPVVRLFSCFGVGSLWRIVSSLSSFKHSSSMLQWLLSFELDNFEVISDNTWGVATSLCFPVCSRSFSSSTSASSIKESLFISFSSSPKPVAFNTGWNSVCTCEVTRFTPQTSCTLSKQLFLAKSKTVILGFSSKFWSIFKSFLWNSLSGKIFNSL